MIHIKSTTGNFYWFAAGIRDHGGTALVLECDITDEQQATGAVERTVAELGRLDTLVNNAGVMLLGPVAGALVPAWQQKVLFTSITFFTSVDAVRGFAGDDCEQAVVGEAARRVLSRWDERVSLHDVAAGFD